jgi:hypothetical protein
LGASFFSAISSPSPSGQFGREKRPDARGGPLAQKKCHDKSCNLQYNERCKMHHSKASAYFAVRYFGATGLQNEELIKAMPTLFASIIGSHW